MASLQDLTLEDTGYSVSTVFCAVGVNADPEVNENWTAVNQGLLFDNLYNIYTPLPKLNEHLSDVGVISSEGLTERGGALHLDGNAGDNLVKSYAFKPLEQEAFQTAQASVPAVDAASGKCTIISLLTGFTFSGTVGSSLTNTQTAAVPKQAGGYIKTSSLWEGRNKVGFVRSYTNRPEAIFEISLPNGQTGIISSFPSFNTTASSMHSFSYYNA